MTGAIFKMYLLLFALAAILPGFLVSFIRSRNYCSNNMEGGWIAGTFAYLFSAVFIYIGLVIFYWDDNLRADDLIGFPMFITLLIMGHVFVVMLFSKFFSLFLEPLADSVCLHYYFILYLGSARLIVDLAKGKNGAVLQWLFS